MYLPIADSFYLLGRIESTRYRVFMLYNEFQKHMSDSSSWIWDWYLEPSTVGWNIFPSSQPESLKRTYFCTKWLQESHNIVHSASTTYVAFRSRARIKWDGDGLTSTLYSKFNKVQLFNEAKSQGVFHTRQLWTKPLSSTRTQLFLSRAVPAQCWDFGLISFH